MSTFKLPEGYSLEPELPQSAVLSDIPSVVEYGGATISEDWDYSGTHYVALCAKNPAGLFRFRVFKEIEFENYVEVILPDDCDGRGSIKVVRYDGQLHWIAWKGNPAQFFHGIVPGSVPFPTINQPVQMEYLYKDDYRSQEEVLDGRLHLRINNMKKRDWLLTNILIRLGYIKPE